MIRGTIGGLVKTRPCGRHGAGTAAAAGFSLACALVLALAVSGTALAAEDMPGGSVAAGGSATAGQLAGAAASGSGEAPSAPSAAAAPDGAGGSATSGAAAGVAPSETGGADGEVPAPGVPAAGSADGSAPVAGGGDSPAGAGQSASQAGQTSQAGAPGSAATDGSASVDPVADAGASATAPAATAPAPAAVAAAAAPAKKAAAAPAKAAKKTVPKKPKAGWYTFESFLNGKYVVQVKGSKAKKGVRLVLKKSSTATGQAFRLEKVKGGYFRIMAGTGLGSRLYVSDKGTVCIAVEAKGCGGMFKFVRSGSSYQIVNVGTGRALAVSGSKAKNNVQIVSKKPKKSSKAQLFTLAARDGLVKSGIYTVKSNLKSTRVLAPKGGSLKADASGALKTAHDYLYERWQIAKVAGKKNVYTLENIATGYRLAASGKSATALKKASSSKAQQWKAVGANGSVIFQNVKTGKVLQPSGGKTKSGTKAVLAKKTEANKQRWTLKSSAALGEGIYEFDLAAAPGLALEVADASTAANAAVQLGADANAPSQRWVYDSVTKTLTSAHSGKVLTVSGAATAGAALVQADYTGAATQRWKAAYLGGGTFRLYPTAASSLGIGVPAATVGTDTRLEAGGRAWRVSQQKGDLNTYEKLGFSVDQMARWQKANNPYLSSYTVSYLKTVLDPANGSKYKFLDLRKHTAIAGSALDRFIATSGSDGKLAGLGSAFAAAAKQYGLNEAYLLAHAILESGWGKSELAMGYKYAGGYIDGKYYKKGTYYNFYGIGAYDSSPLSGGRKLAIVNGWNTPEKAVTGAAKWIASNYVYAGSYPQVTVYSMKWDLERTKAVNGYGWHQYATSTTWADSIGKLIGEIFAAAGKPAGLSFIIPQYK